MAEKHNTTDNRRKLYDVLQQHVGNMGTWDEFNRRMDDEGNRRKVYEVAQQRVANIGTWDEFNARIYQTSAPAVPAAPKQEPQNAATPAAEPQADAATPAATPAQPRWQPTEQDKIRMQWELFQSMNGFKQRTNARLAQTHRMTERFTPEGRRMLKAAKLAAQAAGAPTKVMGITPPAQAPASAQAGGQAGAPLVQPGESPVPYGVKYIDGKPVTEWLLPDGSLTTSLLEADQAEYGARKARLRHQFEKRMKSNGLNPANPDDVELQAQYDAQAPAFDVVADLWSEAEELHKKDRDRNADREWNSYNALGGGRELRVVTASMNRHADNISHLTRFDLQKMMDKAWQRVGPQIYANCYSRLKQQYPGANAQELHKAATDMARSLSDNAVYQYAVDKNTPKSTLEFFGRTVADMNVINSLGKALARSQAGTSGDMAAYDAATAEFAKHHRVAQVGGTVVGMAIDPVTWISGGVGSLAGKGAMWTGGRIMARFTGASGQVATRYLGTTLSGRLLGGLAGGAANLGTYEALKEGERQLMYGGFINPETGKNEGYSAEALWKQAGHGAGMGILIGWVGPVAGNVFDPMVKSATSTGGKIALRGGEQATSALFEGTIFAAPDYIKMRKMSDEDFDKQYAREYGYASLTDPKAKAKARNAARSSVGWDIWNDSMAMMLGFKAQHGIKSAWRTVRDMAPYDAETLGRPLTMQEIAHNRRSFQENLRKALDKSPGDIAMTKEELDELRNAGYGKLASLFRKSDSTVKEVGPDGVERIVGEVEQVEIKYGPDEETVEGVKKSDFDGYDNMARLMQDSNVSEAVRAKAYFILTGRRLPESTIMGYRIVEGDDDGVYVQSLSGQGSVVTNRHFSSIAKAKQEITNLDRQIELNSIEIGERFKAKEILSNAMQAGYEDVAAAHGEDWTAEGVRKAYELAVKDLTDPEKAQSVGQPTKDLVKEVETAANKHVDDFKDDTPDAIRERINSASGVNLDEVVRKERSKRTDKEQAALDAYLKALYPEEVRQGETVDDEAPGVPAPSQGQATVQEAREAGYNMTDLGQREQAMRNLRYQEKRMEELFGRIYIDAMFEEEFGTSDPAEILDLLDQSHYDATERAAIVDYLKACQVGDAAVERMEDDARNAMERENAFIDKVSHEDGFVRPATMKVDSRPVYIVGGHVELSQDGSLINTAASDRVIYIYDPATDKVEQTAPEMLSSLGTATSVEETRAAAERTITEQHENGVRTIQGDMMTFNPGDTFVADVFGDGPKQNRVVGINEDGMILFECEGSDGLFGLMPDQLSAMVDNYKQEAFEAEMRQQAAAVVDESAIVRSGDAPTEPAPAESAPSAPVSIKYDQGDSFRVAVSGREETQHAAVVDREGEAVTIWTPFPVTDKSEKGRTMSGYTTDIDRAALDAIVVRDEQGKPVDYVAANPETEPEAAPAEAPAGPEETVIREGISGTADALKESFTVERERIGNEWLDTQAVQDAMRTYAEGATTIEEIVERAKADSNDERTRQRLDTLLEFDSTRQKLQAMLTVPKTGETVPTSAEMPQNPTESPVSGAETVPETDNPVGTGQEAQAPAVEPMPMRTVKEKGETWEEPDYLATTPQRTHSYIYNESGLSRQEANDHVAHMARTAKEAVDNHKKGAPKIGGSIARYQKEKTEWENAGAELQRAVEFWNEVKAEQKKVTDAERAALEGQQSQAHDAAVARFEQEQIIMAQKKAEQDAAIAERRAAAEEAAAVAATEGSGEGGQRPEQAPDTVQRSEGDGGTAVEPEPVPGEPTPEPAAPAVSQEEPAKPTEPQRLGIDNLPSQEDLAKMSYEVVEQTAADYDASIEERYDAMIEPLESEKAVLESKRRTPAEGKRLKAIDKEIADLERQQEEERLKVGKYFTEELRRRWKNGEHSMTHEEMEQDLFMDEADKVKAETAAKIAAAESDVNTEPTEAQKKAGNYKMGHVEIDGLQISIENPKGSMRRGKDPDGTPWETEMKNTYGYIKGTTGVDGDKIDVFLSDNPTDGDVYVVDQYNKDGSFDEHKVMYGFTSATEAEAAYLSNYSADWAKGRKVVVTGVTREEFKKWLDASDRKKKPFAEYKSVKPIEAQSAPAQAETSAEPVEATEGYDLDVYETKKGKKFHRVKFPRADKEVWKERLDIAKEQFGGTSVPGGYGFKDAETAKAFAEAILHPVSAEGLKGHTDAMAAAEDFPDKVVNEDAVMDMPDDTAADLHIVDVLNPGMTEHSPKEAAANLAEALKKVSDTKLLELLKEHKDNKTVRSILTDEYNRRRGVSPEAVDVARKKPAPKQKPKSEPEPAQAEAEPQPEAEKKARSKWFNEEDQDEAADIIRKMKARLRGGNLYSGIPIDVELLELGCRLGYLIMKKGARKLHEYAQAMIENVGDGIRPYIKQFYNATLATEEALAGEWYKDATPMAEIAKFDMVNFLKEQKPDVVETAKGITAEQEVKAAMPQAATGMVKKSRDKMAIPGYFKPDGSVSAEEKAAKAGADLAAALVDELGLDLKNLPEGVQVITTNFGETGGNIKINLPIRAGYEPLRIDIDFGKTEEGALRLKELTTTVKRGDDLSYIIGEDHQAWLVAPGHKELLNAIRGQIEQYLPKAKPESKPDAKKPAPQPSLFDEPEAPAAPAAPEPQAKTGDKLLMQYEAMKKKHPDAVVLFRVGDFYETFHDDARIISETLGLTLTTRGGDKIPLAGFPHHALDAYLPKLVRAGKRVAICEQLEEPKISKQTVKRGTTPQPATEPKAPATSQAEFDELAKNEFEVDPQVDKEIIADRNGFKIGDTVEWSIPGQGKTSATIIDVDRDGRPILDTGMAPIISSIAEWKDLTRKNGEGSQPPAPQRPKSELSGDSAKEQDLRNVEHDFVEAVSNELIQRINNDGSPLTMAEVRKMAEERGMKDVTPTDLQELVERAVSLRARSIAEHTLTGGPGTQEIGFNKIVKLYTTQPVLSDRDVERIQRQQYSTPVPMGYLMDQFMMSHGHKGKRLLEPSAGNGALTIGVPKENCHVNDIDPRRLANLRAMGFKVITNQDALQPFNGQYDMVVTNPPFGTAPSPRTYDGLFEITTLEGQMAINALESMTDDGRAAIIVGGSIGKWPTPYEKNGRLQKVADRQFFGYLYSHYNVVDIIPIDGKSLYSRNGTGYNVRMILIDGRRRDAEGNVIREVNAENRVFPPVKEEARPEAVTTYDELYKRVQDDILRIQQRLDVAPRNDGGHIEGDGAVNPSDAPMANPAGDRGGERPVGTGNSSRTPRSGLGGTASGGTSSQGGIYGRSGRNRGAIGQTDADAGSGDGSTLDERPGAGGRQTELRAVEHVDRSGDRGGIRHGATDADGGSRGNNADGARQRSGSGSVRLNQPKPVKVELTDEKVASPHVSSSANLMSRMPAAQAQEFERALHELEEKHGNVDEWLTQELGYADTADLYRALAAEQVEGVAMAIDKMNSGRGFIIADQTGIGKGRQAASIIRYAVRNGHKPIFFTQKAGLFSDMYRDLKDIGCPDLKPFIFGSDKDEASITERQDDGTDKVIYPLPKPKERDRVLSYIEKHGTLPDEYDYAVITYSQVQNGTTQHEIGDNGKIEAKPKTKKGKGASSGEINGERRRHVIDLLSRGNYLILDEAHTAGGQSGLGGYMQSIIPGVKGITYLSATYAKRPDNMPLYAIKTAISDSGVEVAELISAVAQGGVPLQEIMSRQLVKSGEMARRERDFTGVTIDWIPTNEGVAREQQKRFDTVSEIFVDIMRFQDTYVRPYLNDMSKDLARIGSSSGQKKGTKDMGIGNAPFASKLYNLLQQLLFSIKVDAVADRAIKNLQNGRKPIISFVNTMEGFLEEAGAGMTEDGSASMPTLSLALRKALDGVMRYTVKDDNNNETHSALTASQLGPDAESAYNAIIEKMNAVSDDLPIAPLDAIRLKIEAAGYKVGELSGRKLELAKNDKGLYVIRNRKAAEKKATAADFNAGKIDVLMVNKTGSTGISLHASSKFEDQRQRVMIAAQFQPDVNDEVQMRGRNDRTGQVVRGAYEYLLSSIPAEQRLQMMFKAKLKSLDANTTSSQKSSFNEMEVVDVLNKYGDAIVWDYLNEDPMGLNMDMGNPLGIDPNTDVETQQQEATKKSRNNDDDDGTHSGFARKALGRLALLPIAEQERVMSEITDRYEKKIHELDERGENDLEISYRDLKAKTLGRKVWVEGKAPGSGNAFADNVYMEQVEVNILDKPLSGTELAKYHRTFLEDAGVETWDEWLEKKTAEIDAFYENRIATVRERITANKEATIARRIERFIATAKDARAIGKNSFTDEEITAEANRRYGETERQEAKAEIERETEKIRIQQNLIKRRLTQFKPMSPLSIPDDLTDESKMNLEPSTGVMVGIKLDSKYSLNGSQVVFAPLDGRRTITLSLKEAGVAFSKIGQASMMMRDVLRNFDLSQWDSHISNESRETRYMLTGNILRALVDMQKTQNARGRITAYTTEDGEVRTGILMSPKFTPGDLQSSAPLSSMLSKIQAGQEVKSSNGEVTVRKTQSWSSRGDYEILVPKSKKHGGKYFLPEQDPVLARYVVGGFEMPRSGSQAIGYIRAENLARVLDHLSTKHGASVMLSSKLKDATQDNIEYRTPEEGIEYVNASAIQPWSAPLDHLRFKRDEMGYSLSLSERQQVRDLGAQEKAWEVKWAAEHTDTDVPTGRRSRFEFYADQYGQGGLSSEIYHAKHEIGSLYDSNYRLISANARDMARRAIPAIMRRRADLLAERPSFSRAGQAAIDAELADLEYMALYYQRMEAGEDVERTMPGRLEHQRMLATAREVAESLGEKVVLYEAPGDIHDSDYNRQVRKQRSYGWYNPNDGTIHINVGRHKNAREIVKTALHEIVGHKTIEQIMGPKRFARLIDEIWNHAGKKVRAKIAEKMRKNGWDFREATKEYLGEIAEEVHTKGYETLEAEKKSIWQRVKAKIQDFLNRILEGLKIPTRIRLTENDLSYMMWKLYKHKERKAAGKSAEGDIFDKAEEIVRREEWERDGESLEIAARSEDALPKRERIEKLRRSDPAIITGDEIEISDNLPQTRKNVIEYGKTLQGEYVNADTGDMIQLQKGRRNGGIKELLQHDMYDEEHIQSIAALPQIIEKGIYIDRAPNNDKTKNPTVEEYQHYVCGLKIGNEDYTVHSIVAVDVNGNRYYDHKLSHIEKGRLLDFIEAKQPIEQILAPLPSTQSKGAAPLTIRSERKVNELISLLQVEDERDTEMRYTSPAQETGLHFRDGDDMQNMTIEEWTLKLAVMLADRHSGDVAVRDAAVEALGKTLGNIRKAMAVQHTYDFNTVRSLGAVADILISSGTFLPEGPGEVKRLYGIMKRGIGHAYTDDAGVEHVTQSEKDYNAAVESLMDLFVSNQLKLSGKFLDEVMKIRGSKVNARGVEVMGDLDVEGQIMVRGMKDYMNMDVQAIHDRIEALDDIIANGNDTASMNAAAEKMGLELAEQYVAEVSDRVAQEKVMRDQLRDMTSQWDPSMSGDARKAYTEQKRALRESIRKIRIERADAMRQLASQVGNELRNSIERVKAFREREKQRIEEIWHNANSDMTGRAFNEHGMKKKGLGVKLSNNMVSRLLLAPAATFEQIMRVFGSKSVDGEGYLFDRYVRGWQECRDKEWTSTQEVEGILDSKAAEILGKRKARWSDLYSLTRKEAGSCDWWDGGQICEHKVTQGNLMYIYMVNKMTDGQVKLRRMCITDDKMQEIEQALDPKLKAVADWLQEELLPNLRNKYNEVHMRMFGAPMAEIDNYFPLRILANARLEEVEMAGKIDGKDLPKTMTGAIIKRRFNNYALDVLNSDAVSVALDHIREMETWAAFAEYRRDLCTLLSYKHFRNQVKNMSTIYGSGEKFWDKFYDLSLLVGGAYQPKTSEFDKVAVNITKLATGACIAIRLNTALKQTLSYPAFAHDANIFRLFYNLTPWRMRACWKWAMKNMPSFQRRWKSRQAGNDVLRPWKFDWDWTRADFVQKVQRAGITPNAFIDALTVAMGSEAVYQSKLKGYLKDGFSKEEAHRRAIQDAEIIFNLSQQSSELPYLSLLQNDRSYITTSLTNFRSSPMSYLRQSIQSKRELANMVKSKDVQIEFETKKGVREGLTPEQAKARAERKYKHNWVRNLFKSANFDYILPALWAFGITGIWYCIFGNDDEKKKQYAEDAMKRGMLGGFEGLTFGGTMPDFMYGLATGDKPQLDEETSPAMGLITDMANLYSNGKTERAANEMINTMIALGVGVNPQVLEDGVVAGMDFFGEDEKSARDWALLFMRVIQCPQSQMDQVYFDELGMDAREASRKSPAELAERYATYKARRANFATMWAYDDNRWETEIKGTWRKKFEKEAKTRLEGQSDEHVNESLEGYNAEWSQTNKRLKELSSTPGDAVTRAAQAQAIFNSPEGTRYKLYNDMHPYLDQMIKSWLSAPTAQQAATEATAIIEYKAKLVEMLDAWDNPEKSRAAGREAMAIVKEWHNRQNPKK